MASASKDWRALVHAAAHDLRAPVANLQLAIHLAQKANDPEKAASYLESMVGMLDRLEGSIAGLVEVFDLQQLDSSTYENIAVPQSWQLMVSRYRKWLDSASAQITTQFEGCETIYMHPRAWEWILENLLKNALDYRRPERALEISVQVRCSAQKMVVDFMDNGQGIDLESVGKNLFKPFRRLSENSRGRGIGLYVMQQIVQAHHGDIQVKSREQEGTAIHIEFMLPTQSNP